MSKALRFIPTAVGNARLNHAKLMMSPVHPHGCGERMRPVPAHRRANGSSPRLWGTRHVALELAGGQRFIPTAVGNANVTFKA